VRVTFLLGSILLLPLVVGLGAAAAVPVVDDVALSVCGALDPPQAASAGTSKTSNAKIASQDFLRYL
jgi:hypothetical protein